MRQSPGWLAGRGRHSARTRSLAGRQGLRGGDKREPRALAGGGHLRRIAALIENQAVGDRLKPGNITGP
jgi:hypothetical protein